jgi:hypothetical protein
VAHDVGIWDASTGGTRYDPAQLEFATPTSAGEVQTQTVWVGNVGADAVPAGAFVMMVDPWEAPAGVTDEVKWRRNQSRNVERRVVFSTDGGVTWHSRAWLPALPSGGTRQEVRVRWTCPTAGDDRRFGPEVEFDYTFPVPGAPDDWPPVVGLEVAIGCRPFLLESYGHWQNVVTDDNYVIAAKWDFFSSPGLGGTVIDPTGGPRGGKCWIAQQPNGPSDALEVQTSIAFGNRQEVYNLDGGDDVLYGAVVGARVRTGEGVDFTEEGIPLATILCHWAGPGDLPVWFGMGENGDINCITWDTFAGAVIQHIVPCTWGQEDYKYLELAVKVPVTPGHTYEAGFYVDDECVWSGTIDTGVGFNMGGIKTLRVGTSGNVYPFNHAAPWYIKVRYADTYLGEPAGPIDQCNFGPSEIHHIHPSGVGTYSGWTRRFPSTPLDPLYTYVDELEWDEQAGTWIGCESDGPIGVEGQYEWVEPKVSFGHAVQNVPSLIAVQPYGIAGGFVLASPNTVRQNYEWSPLLVGPGGFLAVNPNGASAGPWQFGYRTLSLNPWTRAPWGSGDLATIEFGATMTCEWDDDWGALADVFALTQSGLEVAIRPAPPVTAYWVWGTLIG